MSSVLNTHSRQDQSQPAATRLIGSRRDATLPLPVSRILDTFATDLHKSTSSIANQSSDESINDLTRCINDTNVNRLHHSSVQVR